MITVRPQLEKSGLAARSRRLEARSWFCGCCWSSGLPLLFASGHKQRGSSLGVQSTEEWEAASSTLRSPSMTPVQPPPLPLQLVRRDRWRKSAGILVDQVLTPQAPPLPQELPMPGRLACLVPVPALPPRLCLVPGSSEQVSGPSSLGSIVSGPGSNSSVGSTATGGCASEDDILCPLSPAPADERGGRIFVGKQFSRARHDLRHRWPMAQRVVLEETEVRPSSSIPRCPSKCCYQGSSSHHSGGRLRTNTENYTAPALERMGTEIYAAPAMDTTLIVRGLRFAPRVTQAAFDEPPPPEFVT